jgi:uncharacterized protein (TIGR03083 family)
MRYGRCAAAVSLRLRTSNPRSSPVQYRLAMRSPEPISVLRLFGPDRAALLDLLVNLPAEDWDRPTRCEGWSVKDVADHILGGDLANLSRRRDGYRRDEPARDQDLVSFLNESNDIWMQAARRLSPRLVCELLGAYGPPLFDYFASLDLTAMGPAVFWAGPQAAPVWLDVARQYTECWHHQQHIRDAVGRPGQTEPRFLYPVLSTFAFALPVALRHADAPNGSSVHLHISGASGGDWSAVRDETGWQLYLGVSQSEVARVEIDQDPAWRLYTKGLTPAQARAAATIAGDRELGQYFLEAVAIIA